MRNSQQQNNVQQLTPAAHSHLPDDSQSRRQCFAIVSKLKKRFASVGISESAIWSWSLGSRGLDVIGSRSQFSQHDWCYLAARLQAAQRDNVLFSALCDTIKTQGECRVYRIEDTAEHKQVFCGVFDTEILIRCQKHADASGREVILHAYGETKKYLPETPKPRKSPPLSDAPLPARVFRVLDGDRKEIRVPQGISAKNIYDFAQSHAQENGWHLRVTDILGKHVMKDFKPAPNRIFEVHENGNTTQSVEVKLPSGEDMHTWCQNHANEKGVMVKITDAAQHYRLFEFLPEANANVNSETEAMAYIKKHGGKVETEGGTQGNYRVYISDKHGRQLYMYKHHNRVKTQVFQPQ